jgi:predicted deacylase
MKPARRLPSFPLALATVLLAAAPALGNEPIFVGGVTARAGEKVSGWIDVPAGVDAGTRIPVSVINGSKTGPVLALVAGTHGSEYTSILALQRVLARLDPTAMSGALILVHIACPPTFYGRRVYYGPDGKNLNRVFPGKADGTISDRIAWALTREVIGKCTHLVDMHCGDGNESLRPYSYWMTTGNEAVDRVAKEMNLAFGLPHVVIDAERTTDPAKSVYLSTTAALRGKPAITTESGGMGLTDEPSVAAQERGAMNIVAYLKISGTMTPAAKPVWIDKSDVVRTPVTGVWFPAVEKMQFVPAGALLGRVTDPFGKVFHEARAPFAGEVLYVVGTPPVTEGEPLAFVGRIAPEP